MLKRFPERHRYLLIESFLHWPIQCMFPSIMERFRARISIPTYLGILEFILLYKIERQLFDYEYLSLIRHIWTHLSEDTKKYVRTSRFFPCIEYLMTLGNRDPIPTNLVKMYARPIWVRH
ncbi:uncharacterized protein TNCT_167491 [Trichonephila clavata]|uniref:Uncharacterized protein n=1 Tax=Trichonephila clavata TaxID=2740835 RepID=A0A8X6FXY5_TRICU|nr:uncharacterized protein TNCT_167491 [Trichonephila clavata]